MSVNIAIVPQLPNHSSLTTYFTHCGSYRTVVCFDPPMQKYNKYDCVCVVMR